MKGWLSIRVSKLAYYSAIIAVSLSQSVRQRRKIPRPLENSETRLVNDPF